MDTINMGNQMIRFRGMEISLDDIMTMYEDFKEMMGKVNKKFLEPIKLEKQINVDIDESHAQDYIGAMTFVSNMLKAKGEDEPIRMLFQAWLVAKTDFTSTLKAIIDNTDISNNKNEIFFTYIRSSFYGPFPMYSYNKNKKSLDKIKDLDINNIDQVNYYLNKFKDFENFYNKFKESFDRVDSMKQDPENDLYIMDAIALIRTINVYYFDELLLYYNGKNKKGDFNIAA